MSLTSIHFERKIKQNKQFLCVFSFSFSFCIICLLDNYEKRNISYKQLYFWGFFFFYFFDVAEFLVLYFGFQIE